MILWALLCSSLTPSYSPSCLMYVSQSTAARRAFLELVANDAANAARQLAGWASICKTDRVLQCPRCWLLLGTRKNSTTPVGQVPFCRRCILAAANPAFCCMALAFSRTVKLHELPWSTMHPLFKWL
ncbi:hypothetical protein COCSADRAFT_266872 [Bipolaris sorokiniana ND90Pr]|uniref:Secreted protein n=1 Tax=Cochliobolus sativus (strain ND90Pr / ATCC 201652) TaxID=665912 RepID=M2TFA6_COCSN|nr:uncharacterized protein COCSADRAFT_266872 [Bipolaris sorokiniana ND90Pr]EMD67926.1 hypothetical protein COCSADRAFT_266872 [Bipolaris sorokiniana ND90Pr]